MEDQNAGKPLSAWIGTYQTELQEWGDYFSPLVVQLDGTVTVCDVPIRYSYDPGTCTLTFLPMQGWDPAGKNKTAGAIAAAEIRFIAVPVAGGNQATFEGYLKPTSQSPGWPFTGTAPVMTQYKASAAEIMGIAAAYGVALDAATCAALAEALPAFPPSPSDSAAIPEADRAVTWKQGALIGAIVGVMIGGMIGAPFGPAGIVAGASAGFATGSQFGLNLSFAYDPGQVVAGVEHENEHGCCVDINNAPYPVGWIPWIGDCWPTSWRSYNPTTIPGVGILMRCEREIPGNDNSPLRLIGKNLMTKQEEILVDQGGGGHYSWVFTPSQAIIYVWNSGPAIQHKSYIRHSQLGGGKPVVCAGEWTLDNGQLGTMIATLNDSSGHYTPDGGKCMGPVLAKLELLGVPTKNIKVTTR
ncbi:MAG: hypothetical protein ACOY3X_00915 [Pseudomonadota bacterium]